MEKKTKIIKKLIKIGQIGVTVFFLYLIFRRINLKEVIPLFKEIKIFYFFLAVFCGVILYNVFYTIRWKYLLNFNGIEIPFKKLFKYQFISGFFQAFLPAAVGGDIIRLFLSYKKEKYVEVINSIFFARVIGFFILFSLAYIDTFFISSEIKITSKYSLILWGAGLLILLFAGLLFFKYIINIPKLQKYKLIQEIRKFIGNIKNYIKSPSLMFNLFSISFAIQTIPIIATYFEFLTISERITFITIFKYFPFVIFAGTIPISINGYGVTEYLILLFFKKYISVEKLYVIIILRFLIAMITPLIGGLVFMFSDIKFKIEIKKWLRRRKK